MQQFLVRVDVMQMENKLIIGSHVSFNKSDQLMASIKEAISYNSTTFMFYTGAPQNTNRSPIDDFKTVEAMDLMKENNIDIKNVIIHAPYIINLANPKNLDFGIIFLKEELERASKLGVSYLVLHPGSHVGLGVEEGIKNIIFGLNQVLEKYHGNTMILLETMAGKGTEVGRNFEEIKSILAGIKFPNKIGVCLDTCHLNDAGYDISNFEKLLEEFDKVIGIDKIHCVHVNDSKNEKNSHKDRHENIGFGTIGFDSLLKVIYHEKLKDIPKILETPYIDGDFPPYKQEIEMIRNQKFNQNLKEEVVEFYK
jgi:apurinic endonuclease (APN1)